MVMPSDFRKWPEDIRQTPLVPIRGVTTALGNVGGTTLFDAALIGAQVEGIVNSLVVLNPETPLMMEKADVIGFNPVNGEITVSAAFSGQVAAGIPFALVSLPPMTAEIHGVWNWWVSVPEEVEPDTNTTLNISISSVAGPPPIADITVGTITITRIRAGVQTAIVAAVACVAAVGRIYFDYTFPAANWQAGDEFIVLFSGQQVLVGATTYVLPDIMEHGRVVTGAGTLQAMFDLLLAMLVTTETGGSLVSDGTVQTLFEIFYPAGVFEPLKVMIDFTNQTAAETVVVRVYYRIKAVVPSGGAYVLKDRMTFAGVQDPELVNVELEPCRHGILVTLERIAGGVQTYDWQALYRA